MNKILLVSTWLALTAAAFSQSWTGSYNFSGSIDPALWTRYYDTNNLIQVASGFSVVSETTNNPVDTGLEYNSLLPIDQNWSIKAVMQIRNGFNANTNGWLEGYVGVSSYSDWSNPNNSYLLGALVKPWDETTPLTHSYWRENGGQQTFGSSSPVDFGDVEIRVDYSASTQNLLSYFKTSGSAGFTSMASQSTTSWTNLNGFVLVVGGYASSTTAEAGDLTIKSIDIVPEPSALSLLAVGLGGLAMMRRRRS